MTITPFDRSYWVIPGKFLAGYYPGDRQEELMAPKLQSLLGCGIRCFINLMEPDERDHDGRPFVDYAPVLMRMANGVYPVTCNRMPIRDLDSPAEALMIQILDLIDASLRGNQPVYVHCWGGRGRTGTVVGCWLVRHGLAEGKGALAVIQKLRRLEAKAHLPSPEMPSQIGMVLAWREGQ
ncbi:MAG: ADP-ribosylation/Crystallin [Deltaproteobacteria bacterium]|nr:ADP-ribosylation/Crystallin [Deltaproteobacteria bacterium]